MKTISIVLGLSFVLSAQAQDLGSYYNVIQWDPNDRVRLFDINLTPESEAGKGVITYQSASGKVDINKPTSGMLELAGVSSALGNSSGRAMLFSGYTPKGLAGANITHPEGAFIIQASSVTKLRYFPFYQYAEFFTQDGRKIGYLSLSDNGQIEWVNARSGNITVLVRGDKR